MRDLTYPPIVLAARAGFKALGHRFQMSGTEHVPRDGGALMAFNHISYVDFIYGGRTAVPAGRLVRFMAKREIFDHRIAGPLMRSLHHINVDRGAGEGSFHTAVDYLRRGEVVGIFPEATISRAMELKDFKTGAVRIAAEAGVPVIPVIVWGTQRMLTKDHPRDFSRGTTISLRVGEPMSFTGERAARDTTLLRSRMAQMLDASIEEYPAEEQPPGSWWLPASRGGSAPTLPEAARLDVEEKRARAQRRAERRSR